jgi:hypothetical protein
VRKAARAERPVTARIRERMAVEPLSEPEAAEPKPDIVETPAPIKPAEPVAQVIAMPEPVKPQLVNGHRQQVSRRRQADEKQLRLF